MVWLVSYMTLAQILSWLALAGIQLVELDKQLVATQVDAFLVTSASRLEERCRQPQPEQAANTSSPGPPCAATTLPGSWPPAVKAARQPTVVVAGATGTVGREN